MNTQTREINVHVISDQDHRRRADGWCSAYGDIFIPDDCTYNDHKVNIWTGNGKNNQYRVTVQRRPRDSRIIGVRLEVDVPPHATFGKRNWLGVVLVVEMQCPPEPDLAMDSTYVTEILEENSVSGTVVV